MHVGSSGRVREGGCMWVVVDWGAFMGAYGQQWLTKGMWVYVGSSGGRLVCGSRPTLALLQENVLLVPHGRQFSTHGQPSWAAHIQSFTKLFGLLNVGLDLLELFIHLHS